MQKPKPKPKHQQIAFGCAALLVALIGCKELTGSQLLPAGTPNPTFYNSATGALGMRNAAIWQAEQAIPQYIIDAGQLSDELESSATGESNGQRLFNGASIPHPLDERLLPEDGSVTVTSYSQLQALRALGNQAIGALAAYDTAVTDSGTVMRGELYALEGYAEILLADLFCSGVPLSTLDYQRDFTYLPSSTTAQLYRDAIFKFDTALTLAGTDDSLVNFARVGQGRANLDLGQYAAAADDVTTVPSDFQYQLQISWDEPSIRGNSGFNMLNNAATVSDSEGINGLAYRSNGDARTATVVTCVPQPSHSPCTDTLTFPDKYSAALSGTGFTPVILASGTEARLIEAEAQLQPVLQGPSSPSSTWLATLNTLRATAGLPATLTDPATPTARVKLLFRERAYWLFLDGHRQGDLRRLMRQYQGVNAAFGEDQRVYPSGTYFAPGAGRYGSDVTAPIPLAEEANPYFHGCINRNP